MKVEYDSYSEYDYDSESEFEDESLESPSQATIDKIRQPSVNLRTVFPENWLFTLENMVDNTIQR